MSDRKKTITLCEDDLRLLDEIRELCIRRHRLANAGEHQWNKSTESSLVYVAMTVWRNELLDMVKRMESDARREQLQAAQLTCNDCGGRATAALAGGQP